jgi:microcystin-dependent protein
VDGDMSAGFLIGQVSFFTMSTAPTGWLKCNGAAISRTTYAKLFAVTGTTYGVGNGSTTFNLPDLRGEFIRGFDDGRTVDSGRTFGSAQTDDFKSHTHSYVIWGPGASGTYTNSTKTGATITDASSVNTVSVSSPNPSSIETRPRNLALLACIKF